MSDRPIIGNTVGTPLNPNMFGGKVTSVNGKTGDVKLSADDVKALSQDKLQDGVNLALKQAKESGEFNGTSFTYEDFTPEQLESLKGEKGDAFTYDDFTAEQLNALNGEKGDSFTYDDFTPEQLEALKGKNGDKGDAFTYEDFTDEQLEALKVKGDKGDTPQKGVDYYTPAEKDEFVTAVLNALPIWNGGSY